MQTPLIESETPKIKYRPLWQEGKQLPEGTIRSRSVICGVTLSRWGVGWDGLARGEGRGEGRGGVRSGGCGRSGVAYIVT